MRWQSAFIMLAAAALVGCAPKATFDLAITNKTDRPVTVGLVKDGPPYERDLAGPEKWAIESPLESLPPWGHVIPPGRTMDSSPITGAFPQGSLAYLRVYAGERSNAELLAIGENSPDRAEVLLFPGHSQIVVRRDETGRVRAERLGGPGR
jgi:hypothetical protein